MIHRLVPSPARRYNSLKEFYPSTLRSTAIPVYFIGTSLILLWTMLDIVLRNPMWLLLVPVASYGFAWAGQLFFEKNTPATFQYPGYSLASDFILWWHLLTGRQGFRPNG